jgi:hypothetical protein
MGIGTGRLVVFMLACLVAAGGMGAAIGEAVGGSGSSQSLDPIELRKDDRGDEVAEDDDGDDPDGDGTRDGDDTGGGDRSRGGDNTADGPRTGGHDGTRDGDATGGNDGTVGGDNSYVAPAPAPEPYYGGGGGGTDDGGGTDG